ncbi:antirestriction protein, partial [Escherichia coli]|nr:antirestriction protein [Escherichia coli]
MKTLSQNTTSSACAPETDLQQLVATLVPDEQRISFWPQHFGLIPQWVTLEPRVFGWMDRLCEDYCGGIWNLYTLNNGGAFMAPEPDDDDDETWVLFNAMNGNRAEMSVSGNGAPYLRFFFCEYYVPWQEFVNSGWRPFPHYAQGMGHVRFCDAN